MRTYYAIRTGSIAYTATGHETPSDRRRMAMIPRARITAKKPQDWELDGPDRVYRIRAQDIRDAWRILSEDGWSGRVVYGWRL